MNPKKSCSYEFQSIIITVEVIQCLLSFLQEDAELDSADRTLSRSDTFLQGPLCPWFCLLTSDTGTLNLITIFCPLSLRNYLWPSVGPRGQVEDAWTEDSMFTTREWMERACIWRCKAHTLEAHYNIIGCKWAVPPQCLLFRNCVHRQLGKSQRAVSTQLQCGPSSFVLVQVNIASFFLYGVLFESDAGARPVKREWPCLICGLGLRAGMTTDALIQTKQVRAPRTYEQSLPGWFA